MKTNKHYFLLLLCFLGIGCNDKASKEDAKIPLLEKFIFLNESLEHSLVERQENTEMMYKKLQMNLAKNNLNAPELEAINNLAQNLKRQTAQAFYEIQRIKSNLMKVAGEGIDPHTNVMKNLQNEAKVNELMIGTEKSGIAYSLMAAMNKYVDFLNTELLKSKLLAFPTGFKFESLVKGNKETSFYKHNPSLQNLDFAEGRFRNMPVVSAIAYLTNLQSDVLRYEKEYLKKMFTFVDASMLNLNQN
jgi:hypothetical protein